jgi:hypothetical protein
MPGYSTSIHAHWFDRPDVIRAREQAWRERDEEAAQEVPDLWREAVARHEGAHAAVAFALGMDVESVRLTPDADGVTSGTRGNTGFDTIAAMIVTAAGRCGQRKYGATQPFYDTWCRADETKLIELACSLVDRKEDAIVLIEGAERAAKQLVDHLWPTIETLAQALIRFPDNTLERESIEFFCRDVERITFRAASAGEGMMDGVPYRWRQDGYMRA